MEVTKFTGRANINLYRGDCNIAMAGMVAGQYGLAIVDPPYGETCRLSGGHAAKNGYGDYWGKITDKGNWNIAPSEKYFNELARVSKNQIVWGANHYPQHLKPSSGWILWDKGQRNFSFSDGELAYSSYQRKLKIVTIHRAELHKENRNHPNQKPVALYKWLLTNYAKPGDTILDTHGGSMSLAIAAWDLGFDLDLYELDADYYRAGVERVRRHVAQMQLEI